MVVCWAFFSSSLGVVSLTCFPRGFSSEERSIVSESCVSIAMMRGDVGGIPSMGRGRLMNAKHAEADCHLHTMHKADPEFRLVETGSPVVGRCRFGYSFTLPLSDRHVRAACAQTLYHVILWNWATRIVYCRRMKSAALVHHVRNPTLWDRPTLHAVRENPSQHLLFLVPSVQRKLCRLMRPSGRPSQPISFP